MKTNNIIPLKNLLKVSVTRNAEKFLDYVVWKSSGYDNDGWHSYEGPPAKEFDSSFSTKKDANARVEYVFYVQNEWGLDVEEMLEDRMEIDNTTSDDLLHLEICPPDSERWTVAAVPHSDFHADNEENSYDASDEEYSTHWF